MGQQSSRQPGEVRVLILGLDGAGKSTLLYKLKHNEAVQTVPTIGFNVEMVEVRGRAALTVWDVGGQASMRPHWQHFFPDAAGLLFAVDCADRARLGEARRELDRALRSPQLDGVPLVILANKQDVPGAAGAEEVSQRLGLGRQGGGRLWYVQPCSARSGAGLEEAFRRMVHFMKSQLSDSPIRASVYSLRPSATSLKQR